VTTGGAAPGARPEALVTGELSAADEPAVELPATTAVPSAPSKAFAALRIH